MTNTFEIVGKLSIAKESEKFKPYTENTSDSGWKFNKLLFNIQSGQNRHMLEASGMYKADGTGVVYSFTKATTDPTTHERIKGEKIQIPWKDRKKQENIDKIAEFKKSVIDLEKYGRRYELEDALNKQKEGTLSDDELAALGVEDIEKAIEDSKAKRKEFIAEYDFTEYLHKLIKSEKIKDKVFKVSGEIKYEEYNGNFYKKMVPQRIYLVANDEKQTSTGQITLFYNKESLDENSFEGTKKLYINGYARNYDGQRKAEISVPIQLTIDGSKEDEKTEKFVKVMKKQFTVTDDSWKELGVKVVLLDGAQKAEVTEEMLTDFQKEMLELEAITMDEIRAEIERETGGELYGERVQEMVIVNVARGFTKGRKDTVYSDADFVIPEKEEKAPEEEIADLDDLELDDLDLDI
ncbi:MAG: hypothetical protein ACI35O_03880 [Bacillaceae bacterium]